jgi:hypothetical protein
MVENYMIEFQQIIDMLVHEHDEHMKQTYINFMSGDEVDKMWAYGAGLQHAIRSLQDVLERASQ